VPYLKKDEKQDPPKPEPAAEAICSPNSKTPASGKGPVASRWATVEPGR